MKRTIFNDVREQGTWATALSFLFDRKLREVNMHPVRMTEDAADVIVEQDPRFHKTRVTVTFWVLPQ